METFLFKSCLMVVIVTLTTCTAAPTELGLGDQTQPHIVGQYEEQRDPANGNLRPKQCHASTGHCWCVDSAGNPLTEQVPAENSNQLDCDKPRPDAPVKVGEYKQQLEEDGSIKAKQCHGSTGFCWCVDWQGKAISGQLRGPDSTTLQCDEERQHQARISAAAAESGLARLPSASLLA